MYCGNCGNEVNEKAIACPKCGFSPKSEKQFCYSCGTAINPKQLICVKCGVSLSSKSFSINRDSLPNIDVQSFLKTKSLVVASIALIACFLPWLKVNAGFVKGFSLFELSKYVQYYPDTILEPFLLYLFPLTLLGFILSDFIPQLAGYKKYFSYGSLILIAYCAIGIILAANPSTPEVSPEVNELGDLGELGEIANQAMDAANNMVKEMISIGFGFYLSIIATIGSFLLYLKENKVA